MITQPFAAGEVVGKVKGANPQIDKFEEAVYALKLRGFYPELAPALQSAFGIKRADNNGTEDDEVQMNYDAVVLPEVQAALTISNLISDFCKIAPRIVQLHTPDKQLWKSADDATPSEIKSMFRFWRENEDFKDAVNEALAVLDRPNGVEGAADAQLTEAERNDPLSVNAVLNGTNGSKKKPTTAHGND